MIKRICLSLLLAASGLVHAETPAVDPDGFKNPLQRLDYNEGMDQREFERATLDALQVYDPWERWNRRVYHFNYRADEWVMLPVVNAYRYVTPRVVRTGVSNFFSNLGEVPSLLNSLLQFKGKRSLQTSGRLLLNTTVGVVGLWDPATRVGLPRQPEDFGQTLGFYGVPEGPYMMLPLLGPSNLRDTGGLATDFVAQNQINFLNMTDIGDDHPELLLVRAVNARYSTNMRYGQLNSPFEYDKIRYVYTQSRKLQVAD